MIQRGKVGIANGSQGDAAKPPVHHPSTSPAAPGDEAAPGTARPAAAKPKAPKAPLRTSRLRRSLVPSIRQLQETGVRRPNELKALVGFARRFRPTYAPRQAGAGGANVGHPSRRRKWFG